MKVVFAILLLLCVVPLQHPVAQDVTQDILSEIPSIEELENLSLEELMNITITSVSKKPQDISSAAAAVYVITQEDIKRSGARILPEVFRMVPGLSVAKVDSNKWAITSRGFNDRLSGKLLVLLDGRTLYTPLFSGVFWENQDILLDDIERIEVIRGPGATLYGANAVNGVINIITKNAKDSQGTSISAGGGSEEQGFGHIRYGGNIGDDTYYRLYTKYSKHDSQALRNGSQSQDDWKTYRSGFRFDIGASEDDQITVIGDAYYNDLSTVYNRSLIIQPYNVKMPHKDQMWGTNLLARWDHTISETEDFTFQMFYDKNVRDLYVFKDDRDIFDLEFQHHIQPIEKHDIIWGLGYRFVGDSMDNRIATFSELERDDHVFNAFIQDEIALIEDELTLILGTKLEHNEYTGFEYQPNARLVWTPHEEHVFWGSVSRAVRIPSRAEQDGTITQATVLPNDPRNPLPIPSITSLGGTRNVTAEELTSYELGYRYIPNDWFNLDMTFFYNDYEKLLSASAGTATAEFRDGLPFLSIPLIFNNNMDGETYGFEMAGNFQINPNWKVRSSYTFFDIHLHPTQPSFLQILEEFEHRSPHHQVSILSMYDITENIQFDVWARYVSELSNSTQIPAINYNSPSYIALDLRIGWEPNENVEVVLGMQNLLDDRHPEMGETIISTVRSEVERSFYLMTTWTF